MDQIIFGNVLPLPEVSRDQYSCWEEDLSVQVDMVSGRRVIETRGKVQKAKWGYDYMGREMLNAALSYLRSGAPFVCTVLRPTGDYYTSNFLVESMTHPTMAFSRRKGDKEEDFWHQISFVLREEKPHG